MTHTEDATPAMTSDAPLSLQDTADEVLERARAADAGRAAHNLLPGKGGGLTQTVLALRAGAVLQDHVAPGSATLQVLHGSGRLHHDGQELSLPTGSWAPVPRARHGLTADEDLVVLLTVAPDVSRD